MNSITQFGDGILRRANRDDLAQLIQMDQANQRHASGWSQAWWLNSLVHDEVYVLQKSSGEIMAFMVWQHTLDEIELHLIATAPPYRQQGLAEQLLTYLNHIAKRDGYARILLEVRASNLAAQNLYQKLGFSLIATRKHYYKDGEDAHIMEKRC